MASERVYILTAHADPASYTISATRRLAQLIEDPRARLGEACRAVVDNIARHGTLAGLPR